jgi:hypothetical protein
MHCLRSRPILRRNQRCRHRHLLTARCSASRRRTVRSDSARRIRHGSGICCGTDDLFYSDDHDLDRIQSRNTGTIHTLFCRRTICDLHDIRDPDFRDEHEPRANVRLSISRRLLARALDLFHCANIGDAGRRGDFPASSQGGWSLLRKAAPR